MFLEPMSPRSRVVLIAAAAAFVACSGPETTSPPDAPAIGAVALAKASSRTGVSISSASPDSATIATTLDVHVFGSGFANGMVAQWALAGVPDSTQVRTNSTTYVSDQEVIANITISSTATVGSWDVMMMSGSKTGVGSELGIAKQIFKVTDPTATWLIPMDDASLSLQSDHLSSDGLYSEYVDHVCNIETTIFATQAASNSGDATINTGSGGNCSRHFVIRYPDGTSESLRSFNNVRDLENTGYQIPIGETAERLLVLNPGTLAHNPSRCGSIRFGLGTLGDMGIGSDSVLVTRVDASTWHVYSQPAPANLASCTNTGELYPMTVDFLIVSSRPLP
jgi:hypothetical protein